ncbi:cell division protein FtsQ/DivIB [Thalassolituus sp. LLYu03]|uniref:cell division protein FtsQ/DivIB n=1 Tax=Thalassolituus sp. LLYu03 TaxID=3421656 RepID=UPI003D29CAF1
MAKKQDAPRGATPRVVRERKQWTFKIPAVPAVAWQWIAVPVVLAGLIYAMQWSYKSWPITQIDVSGRMAAVSADDVAAKLQWVRGESFFSLNTRKVYDEVLTFPLVQRVVVKKQWPGTLQVVITEDLPLAVWNDKQLLSVSGRISAMPAAIDTSGLARMVGDDNQVDIAMRYFRRVQQSLDERALQINELKVNAVGAVDIRLSNGWSVSLGRQYFEERVRRLGMLLSRLPQERVESLDLRYGKGAAIRWRSEQEMG